jgi:hypothetical protein
VKQQFCESFPEKRDGQVVFSEGDRVEVNWGKRRGWLSGTFLEYSSSPDAGESFMRCKVRMDDGLSCDGSGYHPINVRMAAQS